MRPLLITIGWVGFSVAYFFGVIGLAIGFFSPQGSAGTLVILIAALLLWGYFTAYLISAFQTRDATTSSNLRHEAEGGARRWLATGAAVLVWAVLSVVFGLGAVCAVGMAFGREGDTPHLLGLLAALMLWSVATIWSARQWLAAARDH